MDGGQGEHLLDDEEGRVKRGDSEEEEREEHQKNVQVLHQELPGSHVLLLAHLQVSAHPQSDVCLPVLQSNMPAACA